jgi:hypothetical protein
MSLSFLIPLGCVLLLLAFLSWWQPRALLAQVQWSHAMWNLEEDADRFYARLFNLLESRLAARPLPFSSLSIGPCSLFATRTLLGGEALYLQANYRHLTYYVYACPMPGGLYVSTWLFSKMAGWENHPLLKWLLLWRLYRMTLFGFDALEMFHLTVHGAVLDLLDDYARERGLAPLDEVARRPVLHGFYAKQKGVTSLPAAPASGTVVAAPAPAITRLPFEAPPELPIVPPAVGLPKSGLQHSSLPFESAEKGP